MNTLDTRYNAVTEWLFEQVPMFQNVGAHAYKPGLERVLALSEAFGNPHLKFKAIHVAGTNGKGSTSSLLASVLTERGDGSVGLFTSPHLVDFRERMRIDGRMISKAEVIDFIDRYRAMQLDIEPSFFELTTVMAFDWFARKGVDTAVVEVGLGGRLDSTNIITPEVCIITNISLDHTALLGHTPAEIAAEKAGIIKPSVPVVIGMAHGEVRQVFERKATEAGAPIYFAQESDMYARVIISDTENTYIGTPWGTLSSPLSGSCQAENAATVLKALQLLPCTLPPEAVQSGFERVRLNTGLTGRWTIVGNSPLTIIDTGHNAGGWQHTAPRLDAIAAERPLHMVVGFVDDKDIATILGMMPRNARYYFATPSVKRGRDSQLLQSQAAEHGLHGPAYPDVQSAHSAALASARPGDCIFVGGSTFVVADFLNFFV